MLTHLTTTQLTTHFVRPSWYAETNVSQHVFTDTELGGQRIILKYAGKDATYVSRLSYPSLARF